MPTQMLLFSSSTVKIKRKCSSGEMKSGQSFTKNHPRKTRLDLGKTNWIHCQLKCIWKVGNRDKTTSLRCHTFGTSKCNSGRVSLSVRMVLVSSEPPAKVFYTKIFLHSRSPSSVLPTKMEHDALGLPGRATSPTQNVLLAQLLGKILLKKALKQCRKPLSLESQDCTRISKIVFYISQYGELPMGRGRKMGTVVHSKFSCSFRRHNLETLETEIFLLSLMDVLVGLEAVNGDSTSPASPPDMKDQVQSTYWDLLHCQRGGSALCAQQTHHQSSCRLTSQESHLQAKLEIWKNGWQWPADPIFVLQIFAPSQVSYVILSKLFTPLCSLHVKENNRLIIITQF